MKKLIATSGFCLSVTAAVCLSIPLQVSAQAIVNLDVYHQTIRMADDVELIREFTGRSFDDSPRLPASEVSQRELYLQAQTLFRKANQLAQELAGINRQAAPPAPEGEIQPADTLAVVAAAYEQIQQVKSALGIEEELESEVRGSPISTTGVFMAIIDLNRQLNLVIDRPIRAEDVFEEVSLAVIYTAATLSTVAGVAELPSPPAFDGHKRPADVYARLLACIDVVSEVADKAGVQVLSLSSRRNLPDDIEPGHVYDIARILVADLATIGEELGSEASSPDLPRPPRIFPTQVYQRAGILLQQLQALNDAL